MKLPKQNLLYPINVMINFGSYNQRITIRHIKQSFNLTNASYADFVTHNNVTKNKLRIETPYYTITAKVNKVINSGDFASCSLIITSVNQCIYEFQSTKTKNFVKRWKTYLAHETAEHFNINGKWFSKEALEEVNCAYEVWDDAKIVTALMFTD